MFLDNLREVYGDNARSEKAEIASNLILMAGMALMAVVVTGMLARSITNTGSNTAACVEDPGSDECRKESKKIKDTDNRKKGRDEVSGRYKQD